MTGEEFFDLAIIISFSLIVLSFLLTIGRLIIGPTLPDRILSLDMLVTLAIGFIAIFTILTGYYAYLDMAIALGLVGFLATTAFARFVLYQASSPELLSDEAEDEKLSVSSGEKN